MIGTCQLTDQTFGVLLIRSGREVGPGAEPVQVGCTAKILDIERLPDGRMNIMTVGESRFRLQAPPEVTPEGYLRGVATVTTAEELTVPSPDLARGVADRFVDYLATLGKMGAAPADSQPDVAALVGDPLALSFQDGAALRIRSRERQVLLETDDLADRLGRELQILRRELQTLRLVLTARGGDKSIGPFSVN
jgi:Lon protease-like protein